MPIYDKNIAGDADIDPTKIAGGAGVGAVFGATFWADSVHGDDQRNPGTKSHPLKSWAAAMAMCTDDHGDRILLAPLHAETITAADITLNKSGVETIGMGQTLYDMPTFTYSATGSTLSITKGNTVRNVKLVSEINDCVAAITLGAAADGTVLDNVLMVDNASDEEFLICIKFTAACDNVVLNNCRHQGLAGGATSCVDVVGACDNLQITNCFFLGDYSAQIIDGAAAACTNVLIKDNLCINIDTGAGLGIAFHDSSTGFADGNRVMGAKAGVVGITGTGLTYGENQYANAVNTAMSSVGAPEGVGSVFMITKSLTQSTVVVPGSAIDLTGASVGTLLLVNIITQNGSTEWDSGADGATLVVKSNNTLGAGPILRLVETGSGLLANASADISTANEGTDYGSGTVLLAGKKLTVEASGEDFTSGGTAAFYMIWMRLTNGATIAAAGA